MSVILFSRDEVYKDMADAYESLKGFMRTKSFMHFDEQFDFDFYRSLRRLYFANVATFLCQYHDDTRVEDIELTAIDTFTEFEMGKTDLSSTATENISKFCNAWQSLKYNLCTNDGEIYKPSESYNFIEQLAERFYTTYFRRVGTEE